MEFVRENPGAAKIEITHGLEVGWGTASYHLRRLELEGLVVCRPHKGKVAVFSRDVPEAVRECLATLRDPEMVTLLSHLGDETGVRLPELAAQMQLSRRVISRSLGELQAVGLVEKRGQHRPEYHLAQMFKDLRRRLRTWF